MGEEELGKWLLQEKAPTLVPPSFHPASTSVSWDEVVEGERWVKRLCDGHPTLVRSVQEAGDKRYRRGQSDKIVFLDAMVSFSPSLY